MIPFQISYTEKIEIIRPKAFGFKDYIFSIDIEISGYSAVIIKPVFRPGQFSGYQDIKE